MGLISILQQYCLLPFISKILIKQFTILTFFLFITFACSDDSTNRNLVPFTDYEGTSTYDTNGVKIAEVDDDWTPECYEIISFGDSHICFYYAAPLPAIDTIRVRLACAFKGECKMWLALNDNTKEMELLDSNVVYGDLIVKIPFNKDKLYRNLVYRLFVETTDTSTNITQVHYGDVIWK